MNRVTTDSIMFRSSELVYYKRIIYEPHISSRCLYLVSIVDIALELIKKLVIKQHLLKGNTYRVVQHRDRPGPARDRLGPGVFWTETGPALRSE